MMANRCRHLQRIENKLNQDVETILLLLRGGGGAGIGEDDHQNVEPVETGSSALPYSSSVLSPTTSSSQRSASIRHLPHQPFSIPAVITHSLGSSEQNIHPSPTGSVSFGNGLYEAALLVSPSTLAPPPVTAVARGLAYVDETVQVS